MKICYLIVDDDPFYAEIISAYLENDERLALRGAYTDPEKAREHLADEDIKILFLDMEMPGTDGLSFAASLQDPPFIIFITSHPHYALESYEVNAVDYLLKPIDEKRLERAVNKAVSLVDLKKKAAASDALLDLIKAERDYFVVRADNRFVKIRYIDVLYVEALKDFVKIVTQAETFVSLVSIKNIEASLPESDFVRTHRSFLVNIQHISSMDANEVMLGDKAVPVGNSYRQEVMNKVVGDKLIRR